MSAPACGYCGCVAVLTFGKVLYPAREDLWRKMFWACPSCPDVYVGCHPGTQVPLGSLADKALREARSAAHAAFDPLWRREVRPGVPPNTARSRRYVWLAGRLGIPSADCHIGGFSLELCRRVVEVCSKEAA